MKDDSPELNNDERVKTENNFLKLKLMLEKGAIFHEQKEDLPIEIEHQFLNYVVALEKQIDENKTITVIEKLGSPTHFKPISEIQEVGFEKAWDELSQYMQKCGVAVAVSTPNISAKELYRFSIEEVFNQEIIDIKHPGLMLYFVYEEFHPKCSNNS